MQELQEERKKLQILEQASSSSNLTVDKTGNLVASCTAPESTAPLLSNDAMTAALLAAEEQAAVASGRRLRRREEKGEGVVSGLPPSGSIVAGSVGANGNGNGSSGPGTAATTATTTTASRRKQVNNIYTYSTCSLSDQMCLTFI